MQQARNAHFTENITRLVEELNRDGYYHSIDLPDGRVIKGIQTLEQQRWRISQFPIPQDLRGKRVLDIGAWDGWFSFEMERRGAEVVALDYTDKTRFREAKELMNSKVEYVVADICRLNPRDLGKFDIVLFFGVLYHVKHPLLALENVCALSTDLCCVESFVSDSIPDAPVPALEFYEGTELGGGFDNWFGPNIAALQGMCRTAGFVDVQFISVQDFRAHVVCHRKWKPEIGHGKAPAPQLVVAQNAEHLNHEFSVNRDDYVTVWFGSPETDLKIDDVYVQIGPYAARPAAVRADAGTARQANCKLPLGLDPGWHDVKVAVRDSQWSNSFRIAVDLPREARVEPAAPSSIEISGAFDGRSWERDQVKIGYGSCVSAWVSGIADGTPVTAASFRLDGTDLPLVYLAPMSDDRGLKQVNAMIPPGMAPGEYQFSMHVMGVDSQPITLKLVP